jgi:putative hemolysin
MKQKTLYAVLVSVVVVGAFYLFFTSKSATAPTAENTVTQIANPASVNCANKGGTLKIKTRGDGGEYGVCAFEDNRWCEEWALLRGDCPIGGRKIIGYDTEDQMYCAMLGGTTIAEPNADCKLPNGKICRNEDLFAGTCN